MGAARPPLHRRGLTTLAAVLMSTCANAALAVLMPLAAQVAQPTAPAAERTVRGTVLTPGATEPRPAPDTWVTLHRVGSGVAGPLDSAQTGEAGRYTIAYRRAAADSAVYFLSASYAGITYFSDPLPDADVSGDAAQLIVYDTTTGPFALTVQGRHVVIGTVDSTRRRTVVEVFELSNDSTVTLVASGDTATWTTRVDLQAQEFRVRGGDISQDAMALADGQVRLFAPIAPGLMQFSFSYSLPLTAFPLALQAERAVHLFEVLVEDSGATVAGPAVTETDAVSAEGRTFRRFVGHEVPAASVVRVTMPVPPTDARSVYVIAILLAVGTLMLLALGRSVRRMPRAALGWNGEEGPAPEELVRRIAALDAGFQRRRNPSAEERAEYERQRGGLKAMLTEALVRRGGES